MIEYLPVGFGDHHRTAVVAGFRSSHERTPDAEQAWAGLADYVERLTG